MSNETATAKETIQDKRERLKALSAGAKALVATGAFESVNEALEEIYRQQGHEELHTFAGWLKLGYVVKRGESALLLWGTPRKAKDQQAPPKEGGEPDEYRFFPLAFVFSNLQVQPRITQEMAR
ncbi:MAG: hypothetical protein EOP50_00125 [Sphingobacteriales bacterium]|nr:MAG: hypothetical protein EOP50_00125 [Sphingobacteriales bacterium]